VFFLKARDVKILPCYTVIVALSSTIMKASIAYILYLLPPLLFYFLVYYD